MSVIGVESAYYIDIVENLPKAKNANQTWSRRNWPQHNNMFSQQKPSSSDKNWNVEHSQILEDDLLVVTVWTALGVFGLVTNILILAGICRSKKLRQSTSYWLIMSLAFCDIGMLVVCLAHLIPATILHERYVKIIEFTNAFGVFVYDAFWYTGVLHLMLMSINRYVNICRPKHYLRLFSRSKTTLVILVVYCVGTALAVPGLFACCYLVFNYDFYAGQYEPADTPYRYVDMAVNGSSVVVMTFCYVCIVVRVRRSRIMLQQYRKMCREQTKTALVYAKSSGNFGRQNSISTKLARLLRPQAPIASRREVRLFFQFATVSLIFFLTFFTWSWLPHLSSDSKWIGFAVTSLFFVNNSINPIIYLIFNSVLRRQIQKTLCPFGAGSSNDDEHHRGRGVHRRREADGGGGRADARNRSDAVPTKIVVSKNQVSILRRLRSSGSMQRDNNAEAEIYFSNRQLRRRSTAFDPDDDARLLRTPFESFNDTTDNATDNNATCNLMAMAAFLNTTTITGGVLLKTIQEDEERRRLVPQRIAPPVVSDDGSESKSVRDSSTELDKDKEEEEEEDSDNYLEDEYKRTSLLFESKNTNAILTDDEQSIHL